MPPGESVIQGAVPVYSAIPTLNEVMGNIGFSYANSDDEAFGHALNAALSTPANQVEVWRSDFLERHNWSNVINAMIPELQ